MTSRNADLTSLPTMAMEYIPQPNINAQKIVALVKDQGRITGYQMEDGSVLDKEQAVALAKQDMIRGVGVASRKGNEYLKSLPDESDENNLGNLPSISQSEI